MCANVFSRFHVSNLYKKKMKAFIIPECWLTVNDANLSKSSFGYQSAKPSKHSRRTLCCCCGFLWIYSRRIHRKLPYDRCLFLPFKIFQSNKCRTISGLISPDWLNGHLTFVFTMIQSFSFFVSTRKFVVCPSVFVCNILFSLKHFLVFDMTFYLVKKIHHQTLT